MRRIALWSGLVVYALVGCASVPTEQSPLEGLSAVELTEAPFFPQLRYQCGPAALSTLLTASGAEVAPAQLSPQVFIPAREGSLQLELVAATRRHGRVPLKIRGDVAALATALVAGHPVLVLQNTRFERWPRWHYAAVVGLDPQRDEIILRSGTEQRLRMSASSFMESWKAGGYWGLIVADPTQPPSFIGARAWLEASHGLETTGHSGAALQAYRAAVERWPAEALGWQALGNALYISGDRAAAISAYRESLERSPLPAAFNNLALALGELGCVARGLRLVDEARALPSAPLWADRLQATALELAAMTAADCRY